MNADTDPNRMIPRTAYRMLAEKEAEVRAQCDRLCEAAATLADLAAATVCEPRRFLDNEDCQQQALGQAVAHVRLLLGQLGEPALEGS